MKTGIKHKIINGDSRRMTELEDRSVNLIITSPPYWQLKEIIKFWETIGFDYMGAVIWQKNLNFY